jgi:hypothetical protein
VRVQHHEQDRARDLWARRETRGERSSPEMTWPYS